MLKIFPAIFLALVMVLSERKRWGNPIGWQCKWCMYCMTVYVCDDSLRSMWNVHVRASAYVCLLADLLAIQNKQFCSHCFVRIRKLNKHIEIHSQVREKPSGIEMGLNFKVNLCKRNTKHNYIGLEKTVCSQMCGNISEHVQQSWLNPPSSWS